MSDEVSNFLRSVEQLNHGRHEEEEARSRELEEKLLQQRKERQARREERARSISPQKSSPANTPPPSARHRDSTPQPADPSSPIPDLSARLQSQVGAAPPPSADAMDQPSPRAVSPTKETVLDLEPNRSSASYTSPPPSSGVPTRTPTLSWQRRPPSQGPDRPRSRPLSMVAAENAAARSSTPPAEAASPSQPPPSRDQISQALASKDPAWFRQTADRGATSAAYRKNQVEDDDTVDVAASRSQLPGMSQITSPEPDKEPARERPTSQASLGRLGSPLLTTDAVKLGPPADIQAGRDGTSSGQTSPTRPASPTKGMGGFVQSAMMKRTDSVKRWSVTTPGLGLQRGNSSNRNSFDGKSIATSPGPEAISRPVSRSRDSISRPTSSHGKDLASTTSGATSPEDDAPAPSKLEPPVDDTPPTSPSKTMDPRRWSPTKGSWLDAALNKPESPKPKPAAPPSNQPAWMVELNRAKAEKAKNSSVDLGRGGSTVKKHEVKTGGLVRPAPPGTAVKPPNLTGLPSPSLGGDKPLTPLTPGLRTSMSRSDSNSRVSPASEKPASEKPGAAAEELGRRGSVISPVAKDKPESPQMDFRATLRPRGLTVGKDVDKEPDKVASRPRGATIGRDTEKEPVNELANVFGQLRKTKTQNYRAPDVLKDNITRGKASLNVTGGPRPYEKKDEFKDAILKRKADFQQAKEQGQGVKTNDKPPEEKPLPEGLARRATITRSGSTPFVSHSRDTSAAKSPSETSAKPFESSRSSVISVTSPRESNIDAAPAKAEEKDETPSPIKPEVSTPGQVQNKFGDSGNSLANRFNPALAGILARGPPGMGGPGAKPPGTSSGTGRSTGTEPGPGPKLEHMTKGRARGPRRKAPTSVSKAVGAAEPEAVNAPVPADTKETPTVPEARATPEVAATPEVEATPEAEVIPEAEAIPETPEATVVPEMPPHRNQPLEKEEKAASPSRPLPVQEPQVDTTSPKSFKSSVKSPVVSPVERHNDIAANDNTRNSGVISLVDSSKKRFAEQRPVSAGTRIALVDSSQPRTSSPTSPKKIHEQVSAFSPKPQVDEEKKDDVPPPSPRKLDMKRMSRFLDESGPQSPKTEPEPARSPSPRKRTFGTPTSPRKLPSEPEKIDTRPAVSASNEATIVAEPVTPKKPQAQAQADKPLPEPLTLRPRSPTKTQATRDAPAPSSTSAHASPLATPTRSPSKSAGDVSAMITGFFGHGRPKREYRVDAAELLMNRPKGGSRVQTHKAELFQVTEQGKKIPVPAHYERVLFEREMYICSHTFTNEARKRISEVYFWAGDEVAPSAVEDAQVFVNREARSMGGTLIKMRQGKETAEFIQALGGIVIVRRGSSNKYDSLASNILCGRQFMGQIVFDEVDFSSSILCSGFTYLITQQGKCYLWKGKGAGVDELSCARLIGMDLALMGELVEMDEGQEPENFWDFFGGDRRAALSSADHWRLKPSYEKYCSRLFCSDSAAQNQVVEVNPFSQMDLSPNKIYVLDAFFEMYVIVGRYTQTQYGSFRNALDFAQEYAILAAGMEDRPFVPVSTVVMEGIPRDLRSCFRKWKDDLSPTKMPTPSSGGGVTSRQHSPLKRSRSLRVVPLVQALQVLGNSE